MRRSVAGALALLVVMGGAGACGSSTPTVEVTTAEDSEDKGTSDKPSETAAEAAPEADEVGTRTNPAPAGSTATLGSYAVSLGPTTVNANDLVAAENQFNETPAEGRQFVLAPVTATYNGDESGTAWIDLSIQFVGSAGNTYGTGTDDYCGVIPGALTDSGEIYPGATSTGNVCVSVPSSEVDGGTWVVQESFSFEDVKVFFALQ